MNAKQANRISIRNYLFSLGINPVSSNKSSSFYLAPYREEKTPSLKVSHEKNLWVDFGNDNKGGTLIDLVLQLHPGFSVSDAIRAVEISTQSFFSFHRQDSLSDPDTNSRHKTAISQKLLANDKQQIAICEKQKAENKIRIDRIRDLGNNRAITNYINSRGISLETAKPYCRGVYYTVNGRDYFGVGNKNEHGWSIRNKYWKGCTAQGYSYFQNGHQNLAVFEGIFDLLSYLEMNSRKEKKEDYLVLNSLVNLNNANGIFKQYNLITLFLDHDQSGRKTTNELLHILPHSRDGSGFYDSCKDLNDYYVLKDKEQLLITKEHSIKKIRGLRAEEASHVLARPKRLLR